MKFGVMFANAGPRARPEDAVAMARDAEAAGFESLWTVEHVVVPAGYESAYPYSPSGRMPGPEESPIPDPLVWLSYVAGATSRIRLATGVLILPQRNPLVLAKQLASLDELSGGRLLFGVGVGYLEPEFRALRIPFTDRGARSEEYLAAMRAIWREPKPAYHGQFVSFANVQAHPQGNIRIVMGGRSPAAYRRAVEYAVGWYGFALDLEGTARALQGLARADTLRTRSSCSPSAARWRH